MKCKKSDILSECEYSKDNCFGYKRGELMDYKHLIRFFLQKLKKDNIGAYAAQAALFIIMSVGDSDGTSGTDQDHADADQCGK